MTAPKTVSPATAKPSTPAKPGKKALTETEKAARVAARKAESSEARFVRLAKPRIAKVLSSLRRLETLGRSPAYNYSAEQANRVMKYVDGAVDKVRGAFVARVNARAEDTVEI